MYANIITAKYRSAKDMEEAKAKLMPVLHEVGNLPGFHGFTWLKLADDESMSVTVFGTPEEAAAHREKMPPKAMALIGQHVVGQPNIRHGAVIATK